MKIRTNGKNVTVTEDMRKYLEKRFSKFSKFLKDDTTINVSVSKRKELMKIETFLKYRGQDIKGNVSDKDFKAAVDLLTDSLKNQITKVHSQKTNKSRDSLKKMYKESIDRATREELMAAAKEEAELEEDFV